jgi:hypothetical protein
MNYNNKTYDELLKEQERLDERYRLMSDECAKEGLSYVDFKEKVKTIKEQLYFIDKYIRLKQTPTVEYGREWDGDIYTIEKFITMVKDGHLIDDDGYGYYSTEGGKSDIYTYPSDFVEELYRDDFTHIIWFNR